MRFYLSNALGFFIQLAPCALMIFLPFSEWTLRFRRRRILAGAAAVTALLAALFPMALMVFPDSDAAGNLMMLAAIALVMAGFVWLVREGLMKKVLVFIIVLFYAATQYWLVNATQIVLPPELFSTSWVYSPAVTVLYAACAAVTLPVMLIYVIRPLSDFIREMEPREMRREFLTAMVSTTLFVAVLMYVNSRTFLIIYYQIIVALELVLILEQILIYWLLFRESLRRKRDSERKRAMEIQKLQYDKISREMENTRRLRHDLRHHLNAIGALNAQGRQEEIAQYLKQYGAVYDRLSELKYSGDPVVDGVLEYYLARAREQSVNVDYQVSLRGGSGVEATDMTVLLGNLLENALEALRGLPEEERQLSIEMRPSGPMVLLRVRNRCGGTGDSGEPAGWAAFASREGEDMRGVGLGSVNAIAEKYKGSALFQRKDGWFTTRVVLNPGREQQ